MVNWCNKDKNTDYSEGKGNLLNTVASNSCLILCLLFLTIYQAASNCPADSSALSPVNLEYFVTAITIQGRGLHFIMRPELIKNCRNRVGRTCTWCWVLKQKWGRFSKRQTFLSSRMWVCFGIAQTLVGSFLFCSVGIVQCLFNLLYDVIWWSDRSTCTTP